LTPAPPPHPKEGILEAAEDLLACPNVKQWKQTRVTLIEGDSSGVTGVRLKQRGSEEEDELLEVEAGVLKNKLLDVEAEGRWWSRKLGVLKDKVLEEKAMGTEGHAGGGGG